MRCNDVGCGGGWRGFAAASSPVLRAPEEHRHMPVPLQPDVAYTPPITAPALLAPKSVASSPEDAGGCSIYVVD